MGEIHSGRYFDINNILALYYGIIIISQAMNILQNANQTTTQCTTAYNQQDLSLEIILLRDYDTTPINYSIF